LWHVNYSPPMLFKSMMPFLIIQELIAKTINQTISWNKILRKNNRRKEFRKDKRNLRNMRQISKSQIYRIPRQMNKSTQTQAKKNFQTSFKSKLFNNQKMKIPESKRTSVLSQTNKRQNLKDEKRYKDLRKFKFQ